LLLTLNERTSDTAGVLVTDLVDMDGVVAAVVRDDEGAGFIIGLGRDETGVEAENVHVLLKHLFHVELGGFSLESDDWTHGVLFSTVASVGGDGLVKDWGCRLLEGDSALLHIAVFSVPSLSEVIGIVDKALAAPNVDGVSALEVCGWIEFFWAHVHAGAVGKNGGLGELLALEEFGEGIVARVGLVDFLDFNGVVGEEVVETEVTFSTVVAVVVPQDSEWEDRAVIVEEALKVLVGAATLQHDFHIVFDFSLVWGGLFHVDHSAGVYEGVFGKVLGRGKLNAFVGVEAASKIVAIDDAEDSGVDVDGAANCEITPGVKIGRAVGLGNKVALKENSLRDTWVLDARLDNVNCVVLEVVENDALAEAVVLSGVLNDGLLEVGVELKDLDENGVSDGCKI
jgi:hypothetical protein